VTHAYKNNYVFSGVLLIVAVLCVFYGRPVNAEHNCGVSVVIYSEVKASYQSIFDRILNGINKSCGDAPKMLQVDSSISLEDLEKVITDGKYSNVIALSNNIATKLNKLRLTNVTVIAGGFIYNDLSNSALPPGYSLSINPQHYLDVLSSMSPNTKSLYVFYMPGRDEYVLDIFRRHTKKYGLTLIPQMASNLDDFYANAKLLSDIKKGSNDAIFVTRSVLSLSISDTLNYLLKISWNRQLIFFSDLFSGVSRGILFSLFPDYYQYGILLGSALTGKTPERALLLDTYKITINSRTARHLGLVSSINNLGYNALIHE